jgi:hypothetical protein
MKMNYQFLLIYSDQLKKIFYLCSFVFLFSTYSCVGAISVEPPCTDKATMSIDVPVRYLGSCSAFFETATQPMKVQITVDGFSVNGDSIKTTVMDAFRLIPIIILQELIFVLFPLKFLSVVATLSLSI